MGIFFKVKRKLTVLKTNLLYKVRLKKLGKCTYIEKVLLVNNMCSISLGNRVAIGKFAWLMAIHKKSILNIEDDTSVGHYAHIVALNEISIGRDVLIADKVFISDCSHRYLDIDKPIKEQGVEALKPVRIGEGTWIGENCAILGCAIGKHCVIGANSVVTKDVGDYCVVVGAPAKIIKRFDFLKSDWVQINEEVYEKD